MRFVDTISWYFRRLRVMSVQELFFRVEEQCYLLYLKLGYKLNLNRTFSPSFGDYSFCTGKVAQLPELPWSFNISSQERRNLLSGQTGALGFDWVWSEDDAVWHIAPDTGKQWPREFFAGIACRSGNPVGDVRVIWEPSRLQQLVALALLANNSTEEEEKLQAVELLRQQLISWDRANPLFQGVHYISSMECSLRLLSACYALDLARPCLRDADEVWQCLVHLVITHAGLMLRRLSLHSSSGNHTIAEAVGLVYAGVLFPEYKEAGKWKRTGLDILGVETDRQILADGGGIERALWYHVFVTDLCGLALKLLKHHGEKNLAGIDAGFRRARLFLNTLASCPGELPGFGDSDNGYALSSYLRLSWDDAGDGDAFNKVFGDTGLTVISCREETETLYFDHGPLGMAPGYGHGHADGLSVVLKCSGRILLLDPGTYTYTGDASWREYFRSTRAHNTVCVDGEDQATQVTSFMWADAYVSELKYHKSDDDRVLLLACHDGYYRKKGVIHWRGIIHSRGRGWVVWDYLDGSGRHELELNWHARDVTGGNKEYFNLSDTVGMKIENGETRLISADDTGFQGWISDTYGIKYPGKTICSTYSGDLPHEFITRISVSGRILDDGTISQALKEFKLVIDEAKKD